MDWKTPLDGLVGGVVGAGAALLATCQQIKAERRGLRRERARTAATLLLDRLADLDAALPFVSKTQRDSYVMRLARGNPDPFCLDEAGPYD